jgi:hypothetical protein
MMSMLWRRSFPRSPRWDVYAPSRCTALASSKFNGEYEHHRVELERDNPLLAVGGHNVGARYRSGAVPCVETFHTCGRTSVERVRRTDDRSSLTVNVRPRQEGGGSRRSRSPGLCSSESSTRIQPFETGRNLPDRRRNQCRLNYLRSPGLPASRSCKRKYPYHP